MNRRNRVTTEGAAQYLGVSRFTLEHWRGAGRGPVFYKIGRLVTYALEDLDEFARAQRRLSTNEPARAAHA